MINLSYTSDIWTCVYSTFYPHRRLEACNNNESCSLWTTAHKYLQAITHVCEVLSYCSSSIGALMVLGAHGLSVFLHTVAETSNDSRPVVRSTSLMKLCPC